MNIHRSRQPHMHVRCASQHVVLSVEDRKIRDLYSVVQIDQLQQQGSLNWLATLGLTINHERSGVSLWLAWDMLCCVPQLYQQSRKPQKLTTHVTSNLQQLAVSRSFTCHWQAHVLQVTCMTNIPSLYMHDYNHMYINQLYSAAHTCYRTTPEHANTPK